MIMCKWSVNFGKVFVLCFIAVSPWIFPLWHFCPVILIISETLFITAPVDGGGRKEVYNHVQLVLLHILSESFHCANDLFVPIICFAELVNPHVPLSSQSDCCVRCFSFTDIMKWRPDLCVAHYLIQTNLKLCKSMLKSQI